MLGELYRQLELPETRTSDATAWIRNELAKFLNAPDVWRDKQNLAAINVSDDPKIANLIEKAKLAGIPSVGMLSNVCSMYIAGLPPPQFQKLDYSSLPVDHSIESSPVSILSSPLQPGPTSESCFVDSTLPPTGMADGISPFNTSHFLSSEGGEGVFGSSSEWEEISF